MPTLLETASKLDETLNTGWAGLTPIAIDNIPFVEVQGQAYLQTVFTPYVTENVLVGSQRNKRKRTIGAFFIKIRIPLESGVGLAYDYANQISDIMENKCLLPDFFTEEVDVTRGGDTDDGWFNLICNVNFSSDET